MNSRITVEEVRIDLELGRKAVVEMLEQKKIPGIKIGHRWIITRHAYEQWKRTCGVQTSPIVMAGRAV